MIYLKLFWSFIQVGLFSIGGGYATLPLVQNQVVDLNGWLDMGEFADIITISQMTPGPIAINTATFVGTRIAGIGGAVIATLGCVLPSFIIVLLLAVLYKKYGNLKYVRGILSGLQPAVVGLIASAGLSIIAYALWSGEAVSFSVGSINFIGLALIAAGVIISRKAKPNPIFVILGSGIVGGIIYSVI
ncbi:MAG: chromate transporter [Clostridiales bacterium]|nr:chromate transporter [Clostridiales bacterium]